MVTPASAIATNPWPSIRAATPEPACLPVIDFACLHHQPTPTTRTRPLVIQDIGRACQKLGCFQVINHGINKAAITGAMEAASDFFQLSTGEKTELASEDVTKPVRYSASSGDKPRAFLKHYAHPLSEWVQFWPLAPPDYREKMGKYTAEVRRVAMRLMDAILESLGLGQAYLSEKLEEGMQVVAVNCYDLRPSGPPPASPLGLGPHTDYGCLTVLFQSCPGLQIMDRDAEAWRAVPETPEALEVHLGDYLEVLSNGRYRSVVHRAVIGAQKRISIASIHSLSMDERVVTPDELVDKLHPKGYRGSSLRDFLGFISANDATGGGSFIDSLRIVDG